MNLLKTLSNFSKNLRFLFRSLKYPNFRLFFAGQSISLIGTWMQRIALPWLVFELTNSVFMLGLVSFAGQIPTFIISPFAGVLADRWNKYKVLVSTQIISMIQAFAIFFLVLTQSVEIWHIVALNIFLGCVHAVDIPVRQSFMIKMIDKKEDLSNAIALNSTMVNAAKLIGPSIAGIIIAFAGTTSCFLINGMSYMLVIASLLGMKSIKLTVNRKKFNVLSELQSGFRYTVANLPIKSVLLLLALVSLAGMPYIVLMPVFTKDILNRGPETYGFLMGATGVGALIGALYLASRNSTKGLEKLIPVCAAFFGAGLVVFSFSRNYILSMIVLVATGLGMMLQLASSNTLIQSIVDENKRGRVMGFYAMAFMGTVPFGSILSGASAKWIGAPNTILAGGIICIIGALVYWGRLPEITGCIK